MSWLRRNRQPDVPASPIPVELRDPTAATRPLQWVSPGLPQVPNWDAHRAIRQGWLANWVVARSVAIIADQVASFPFRAGPALPANPWEAADTNPGAPLAKLLGPPPGGPAPKLTARRWWAWVVAQRIVTGRYGSEIETDSNGRPIALWPLTSASLRQLPSTSGTEWFSGFVYGPPGEERTLPPERVLYGWTPSLDDFRQPYSPLQSAALPISVAVMLGRYQYGFLRNGATPATVVVTQPFATDEESRAFRRQFSGEFGGVDNAGRTAFLEAEGDDEGKGVGGMIDVHTLGTAPKDAQMLEQEQRMMVATAAAIGVPWSRIDASGRTFDNAGQENANFLADTIVPLVCDLADEINQQLAPRLGNEVGWFDLSSVADLLGRTPDPMTAKVGAPTMVQAQLMTINEARKDYGLAPIPDGDRFMTADEIALLKGPQTLTLTAPAGEERTAPPEPTAPRRQIRVELAAPERRDRKARAVKIWSGFDATARALEQRMEREMARLFGRQAKATLARLEGNRGRKLAKELRAPAGSIDPSHVFDRDHWRDETDEAAQGLYESMFVAGATRLTSKLGVSFDVDAQYAQDFIKGRANKLAGAVTDTTYEAIRQALADGAANGLSIPDLADAIRHVFEVASTSRATMIARTETISAYNGSAVTVAQQLGSDVVAGQEWIATQDGRTRPEHAAADGQTVDMDAAFDVGGEQLAYPGDPNGSADMIVNCRCTVAFLTPDEMSAAPDDRGIDPRVALGLLAGVGDDFDERRFRRALEAAA